MSLNLQLLQGPNFTNTLLGVLTRFRQDHVTLMADIEAMFHQVKVSQRNVDFLRFLWWPNGDITQSFKEYRMKVHLFGAISSPSCSNYALRKLAEDYKDCFPNRVLNTILHNFYVDDCLTSVHTEEEALHMVKDLTAVCSKGGFQLSKWMSNSRKVLASIPEEHLSKSTKDLNLDKDNLPVERALGLHWCVESDAFMFKIAVSERPYTRRGILSVVSSIYDPLGFLSPLILPSKLLLQELCKRNIGWDDEMPQILACQWSKWLQDLKRVVMVKVDRCIMPKDFGKIKMAQLHHFSDASECGYGTVSYLRLEETKG